MIIKRFNVDNWQGHPHYYGIIGADHSVFKARKYYLSSISTEWNTFHYPLQTIGYIRGDKIHNPSVAYTEHVEKCYQTKDYYVLYLGSSLAEEEASIETLFMEHIKYLKSQNHDTL